MSLHDRVTLKRLFDSIEPALSVFFAGGDKTGAPAVFKSDAFPSLRGLVYVSSIVQTSDQTEPHSQIHIYTNTYTHPPVNCLQFLDPSSLPFTM